MEARLFFFFFFFFFSVGEGGQAAIFFFFFSFSVGDGGETPGGGLATTLTGLGAGSIAIALKALATTLEGFGVGGLATALEAVVTALEGLGAGSLATALEWFSARSLPQAVATTLEGRQLLGHLVLEDLAISPDGCARGGLGGCALKRAQGARKSERP